MNYWFWYRRRCFSALPSHKWMWGLAWGGFGTSAEHLLGVCRGRGMRCFNHRRFWAAPFGIVTPWALSPPWPYHPLGFDAPWHCHPLAPWPHGFVAPSHFCSLGFVTPLALSPLGFVTPWLFGIVTLLALWPHWHCHPLALSPHGIVTPWHYGSLALSPPWLCHPLALSPHGIVTPHLTFTTTTAEVFGSVSGVLGGALPNPPTHGGRGGAAAAAITRGTGAG